MGSTLSWLLQVSIVTFLARIIANDIRQNLQESRETILSVLWSTDVNSNVHHLRHRHAREPERIHSSSQSKLPIPITRNAILDSESEDGQSRRRSARRAGSQRRSEGMGSRSEDGRTCSIEGDASYSARCDGRERSWSARSGREGQDGYGRGNGRMERSGLAACYEFGRDQG